MRMKMPRRLGRVFSKQRNTTGWTDGCLQEGGAGQEVRTLELRGHLHHLWLNGLHPSNHTI